MSLLLIDADSCCYSNCFTVEKKGELIPNAETILCNQLDKMVETMLEDTGADDYKMFITGQNSYRKLINPNYKANRANMTRPILLDRARQHLVEQHLATTSDWIEADDAVAIECTADRDNTIIAHIDKDIDQVPGNHYRWKLRGKLSQSYYISEIQGLRNRYVQALTGDKCDNIMYYLDENTGTWKKEYGMGEKKAIKIMDELKEENEMIFTCLEWYAKWGKTQQHFTDNMEQLFLLREKSHVDYYLKRYAKHEE